MNTIKKAICGGMIGLAGLVSNGCTTEANAFGQGLVQSAIVTGVTSGTDAIVRNEFEGPRGTTIVNNNGYQAPQGQVIQQKTPENVYIRDGRYYPAPDYTWVNPQGSQADLSVVKIELLSENDLLKKRGIPEAMLYTKYTDKDNNGLWSKAEFEGIKDIFRDDEPIGACFFWGVVNGDLNGKKVTMDVLGLDTNRVVYNFGKITQENDDIINAKERPYDVWATKYSIPIDELKTQVGGTKFRIIGNLDGVPKRTIDFILIPTQSLSNRGYEDNLTRRAIEGY